MRIFLAFFLLPLLLGAQSVGTLAPAGRMAKSRTGHTATLLDDGKVLFTGGKCDGVCETSIEIYDPATGISSEAASMLYGRTNHAAVLLADGRVLISGGAERAEIIDPASNKSEPFPLPILSGLTQAAFRLADGRAVFACGGGSMEIVDLVKATVEYVSAGGCRAAAALPDGRLFVSNGSLSHSAYDPAPRKWELLQPWNPLYDDYAAFTSTALPDGSVAVAGGLADSYPFRDSTFLFDRIHPLDGTAQSESLKVRRHAHTACLSPDGLLLSGGTSGSNVIQPGFIAFQSAPLSSLEVRDFENGAFAGLLQMNSTRTGHTCTLLNDGSVLLAGGHQSSEMQRYIPANKWPELKIAAAVPVRGEALELYVSGLLESSPHQPQVIINGKPAELLYFAPGQINVGIPKSVVTDDTLAVQFTYLGRHSGTVSSSRTSIE